MDYKLHFAAKQLRKSGQNRSALAHHYNKQTRDGPQNKRPSQAVHHALDGAEHSDGTEHWERLADEELIQGSFIQ